MKSTGSGRVAGTLEEAYANNIGEEEYCLMKIWPGGVRIDAILSIDQSTSAAKGMVWDTSGRLLSRADIPHRQITTPQGWVEHDPEEIYLNTLAAACGAVLKSGLDARRIITAERATLRGCYRRLFRFALRLGIRTPRCTPTGVLSRA